MLMMMIMFLLLLLLLVVDDDDDDDGLVHVHGTNFHHRFVAFLLLLLLNVNLRHIYTITLLIHIVRRPCCFSALTSP